MAQVNWSERSIKDINEIAEYIAKDSVRYAKEYVSIFFEKAKRLGAHPYFGRPVPELGITTVRQILCDRYRIIYEIVSETHIAIITVHHQSRRLRNNPAVKKLYKRKKK